ncbi:MAG TPA: helix-turn-helix transcriptional regulator [Dysgonamonadaceae bacterium]|jgi:transcriptional regulator with XRE-family HTH domain|nr:helix-turn-helix transcriptional regulator [Dysgonamonadaceae bacterium]
MRERIRQIMEHENLTPAKFADKLQISRAVISHILNGRNNPSLDVVTKILTQMDYINPEWLLTGKGSMYKNGRDEKLATEEPDLFRQNSVDVTHDTQPTEERKENDRKPIPIYEQRSENKTFDPQLKEDKKITRIIIYYDDNTYETFIPEKIKN